MNWLDCYSSQRLGQERGSADPRSAYERDYDRIIFSSAFRRLQNKTQVFPLPEHVLVHNRLTHSLEVVSVGRSLGVLVGNALADQPEIAKYGEARDFYRNQLKTVISAACLAHDLGNPAFGHSGEEAISKYFKDRAQTDPQFQRKFTAAQWEDLVRFEGNANAFRILTREFEGRMKGGYQMTYSTLASILKYPCESVARNKKLGKHRSKYGFFQSDRAALEAVVKELPLKQDTREPLAYYRHPFVYLTEAADDICYNIIDYEDAHRLGIITYREVEEDLLALLETDREFEGDRVKRNLQSLRNDPNEAVAYLRAKSINYLVNCCAQSFLDNQDSILKGEFSSSLLGAVAGLEEPLRAIASKSVERIYNHESVIKIELAGFKIMSGLMEDLVEAALTPETDREKRHKKLLGLMPQQYKIRESDPVYEKMMSLLDYVSGMTDNYALELYRNLRGISVPGI